MFSQKFGVQSKQLLIHCLLLFSSSHLIAQPTQPASNISTDVHELVQQYVDNYAFSGGILVTHQGQIVHQSYTNLVETKRTAHASDRYILASLSKPITATLFLRLEQAGKVKRSDKLAQYLAEFDKEGYKTITLDQLLSHRSGVDNHFSIPGWFDPEFHKQTSESAFIKLIAEHRLLFEPGTDYAYSNPGYFLLGKVIERVTSLSFEQALQAYVLSPLAMTNTGVSKEIGSEQRLVRGYEWEPSGGFRPQQGQNMALFGAGAAIYSNVLDLAKFERALSDTNFLSDQSKAALFNPESAYSWQVGSIAVSDQVEVFAQRYDGQITGYSSMLTRMPEGADSVILTGHIGTNYFLKKQLSNDIIKVLQGLAKPDRNQSAPLLLTKGLAIGQFDLVKERLVKGEIAIDEPGITAIAYQLLWSGSGEQALQLFALLSEKLTNSNRAKQNLTKACQHRLTQSVAMRKSLCQGVTQ